MEHEPVEIYGGTTDALGACKPPLLVDIEDALDLFISTTYHDPGNSASRLLRNGQHHLEIVQPGLSCYPHFMNISAFDLFKIGIGPSSSHTMGPMKAAYRFAAQVASDELIMKGTKRVKVELFGSLGATGRGHESDKAVVLGLSGFTPEEIDPDHVGGIIERVKATSRIEWYQGHPVAFDWEADLTFADRSLSHHPNALRIHALDARGRVILRETYYSLGGGFIIAHGEVGNGKQDSMDPHPLPYPFSSGAELLALCSRHDCSVSQLVLENEISRRPAAEVHAGLTKLWKTMQACVRRGMYTEGKLPGSLNLHRRAPVLRRQLESQTTIGSKDPLQCLDWVDLYALAVGEENACGGRIVTAPTTGAAGIIPAVLHYITEILQDHDEDRIHRFLLTAAAIGALYKENASLSAADVGCQGEIGVACSMAAGALAEYRGGTPPQVTNAAEIGMEHNLGLTCDPIAGLVQIPCIERNAMGAVKAINAARMALRRERRAYVSLDNVIKTMRETGADMSSKYKETAKGGLAVNVPEC